MFEGTEMWLDGVVNASTLEELQALWPLIVADIPELAPAKGMEQPKEFHIHDVLGHTFHVVLGVPPDPYFRLAALLHDVGKTVTRQWNEAKQRWWFPKHADASAEIATNALTRLGVDPALVARAVQLIRRHEVIYEEKWSDKAVRRLLAEIPMCDLYTLRKADLLAQGGPHVPGELALLDKLVQHACRVTGGQL